MMRVVKVLNNSVILAVEDGAGEVILMGKGIGFRKTIGQTLESDECERVFVLRDRETNRNILQLAAETDERIFEITRQAVDYAVTKYHMQLRDHLYLALTDHLAFAVRREAEGTVIPSYYAVEVRRYNPEEYDVGRYARQLVQSQLGVELPEYEITNIAFHFINAQHVRRQSDDDRRMAEIVKGVLEIVKYNFGLSYNEETVSYSRFLTHVQALAQRLVQHIEVTDDLTEFLYQQVVPKCPEEYRCAGKVAEFLDEAFHITLSHPEALYLTMHIHRIREEHHTGLRNISSAQQGKDESYGTHSGN